MRKRKHLKSKFIWLKFPFLLLNTRFIEQTILLNERFYWANDVIEQFFNEKKSDNFENEWNKFFFWTIMIRTRRVLDER